MTQFEFQAISWDKSDTKDGLVINVYGMTSEGKSIGCKIKGFRPYFYLEIPSEVSSEWCAHELQYNAKLLEFLYSSENGWKYKKADIKLKVVSKTPILGYCNNEKRKYIKVSSISSHISYAFKEVLKDGVNMPLLAEHDLYFNFFENKVDPFIRFMHERNIQPAGWITLDEYSEIEDTFTTQLQMETHHGSVHFLDSTKMSPFVTMSFDIECNSKDGTFPQSDRDEDAVIQIGCSLYRYGTPEPYSMVLFNLGDCGEVEDTDVRECETEEDLLVDFRNFVVDEVDPDVILGYNIRGFDMGYLWERAEKCGVIEQFQQLGRRMDTASKLEASVFDSGAYGRHEYKDITMKGRLIVDLFGIMQREHKLIKYSLNFVSEKFLGETKKDVSPADIFALYNRDKEGRTIVADYCIQDTKLPERLMQKLSIYPNLFQMANVTLTPLEYILTRGQQIKVYSLLVYEANKKGYIVNTVENNGAQEPYVGATVLTALKGYYQDPITGLDFASLYPTIMISNNLCFTTYVTDQKYANLPGVKYKTVEMDTKEGFKTYKFVQEDGNVQGEGLLPHILKHLLSARRKAKKDMNNATDPFVKAVYNGKQLALKVTCNSVYGFCGAGNGMLPCIPIASCTTTIGRNMIEKTKNLVEKHYDCKVVYGDTDSVMVKFHTGLKDREAIEKSFEVGIKAGEFITEKLNEDVHYKGWIDLEFEKVYHPYALFTKKRYFGRMYEHLDKPPSRDVKGLQIVRRDNCPIVKEISNDVINLMLDAKSAEQAKKESISVVVKTVNSILNGECEIERLILSKSLQENVSKCMSSSIEIADALCSKFKSIKKEDKSINAQDLKLLKTHMKTLMKKHNVPNKSHTSLMNAVMQYTAGSVHSSLPRDKLIETIRPHTMVKYKNPNMPQVKVAEKMWERDPGNAPRSGDRIPYVFVKHPDKKAKQFMKAEDPEYVVENKLELDTEYYILHQLKNPVCDLLSVIMPIKQAEELFDNQINESQNKKSSQKKIDSWFIKK